MPRSPRQEKNEGGGDLPHLVVGQAVWRERRAHDGLGRFLLGSVARTPVYVSTKPDPDRYGD